MDRRYFLIGLTTAFTFCAAPILAITKAGAKKTRRLTSQRH